MTKLNSMHQRAIVNLSNHPEIIGLENIIGSAIEVNLFDNNGRLIAQPDIIFVDNQLNLYIIEYKSNGDKRLKRRAEEQLYEAVNWFSKQNISAKTMIIDGEKYPELRRNYNPNEGQYDHNKLIKTNFRKR